jgi:hypothetical protein
MVSEKFVEGFLALGDYFFSSLQSLSALILFLFKRIDLQGHFALKLTQLQQESLPSIIVAAVGSGVLGSAGIRCYSAVVLILLILLLSYNTRRNGELRIMASRTEEEEAHRGRDKVRFLRCSSKRFGP